MESFLTIVRSKISTFQLFEVTFLLEKWKLLCLIYTFRVPRRSKKLMAKTGLRIKAILTSFVSTCILKAFKTSPLLRHPLVHTRSPILDHWGRLHLSCGRSCPQNNIGVAMHVPNYRKPDQYISKETSELNLLAELSFVTLTIHLCNGLNDKNLVKPRKTCFLTI